MPLAQKRISFKKSREERVNELIRLSEIGKITIDEVKELNRERKILYGVKVGK